MYQSRYLLKAFPVSFIKCIQIPAVYIQDRDYLFVTEDRDYYFAARQAAAGNMTRELLYIGNDDAFLAFPRCPAQAHLQSSVFKLSKDLIDSIHEEGIVAYTS